MNDYFQFKQEILKIVDAWKKTIKPHIEETGEYGETNTRKYIIDPILNALNWVDDGSKNIVDNEFSIKHQTGSGSADYALKVNKIPKILIEAKDVAKVKDLENGYDLIHGVKRTYPRQLSNYCHDLNYLGFEINFSILTNGVEWIVYNTQYADISSEREVIFRLEIDDLDKDENLKILWALEYGDFCNGFSRLREIIQRAHDFRLDIDKKAVQQLLECKDLLSSSIISDYEKDNRGIISQIDDILNDKKTVNGMPVFQNIPEEERLGFFIKEASSSIINKILFIRILEDKNFLTPKLTKRSIEKWKDFFGYRDYNEIMNLFREACRITEKMYNGGLFQINPYDEIEYDPLVIKKIIDILGDINFRVIDSDIIGRIYEIYLGYILKVELEGRSNKKTRYVPDNTERKKLGQYYTPKFVVDFIVKNTLGKLIEGKKPDEVEKIRVLDPACGSGSFLINAFDLLAEYYEKWNGEILKKIAEINKKQGAKITHYQDTGLIPNYRNIILKDNIHGVDLNDLSVQICEINLWLRALERDKKLLKLNKNILHGNSLITGVEDKNELSLYEKELEDIKNRTNQIKEYYEKDELTQTDENRLEALEKNLKFNKTKINTQLNENLKEFFGDNILSAHPFNWEVEFPQIMQEGGFDLIIGNPPYVNVENLNDYERNYFMNELKTSMKRFDIYIGFIEKGIELLKDGGLISYIIPFPFLTQNYAEKLRKYILNNCKIILIADFSNFKVFQDAVVKNIIIIIQKSRCNNENEIEILKIKEIERGKIKFDCFKIEQKRFLEYPENMFRLNPPNISEITNKIEGRSMPLKTIAVVSWGARGVPVSEFHLDSKINEKCKPMVKGKDVSRYSIKYDNKWFLYDVAKLYRPSLVEFFENEKILISKVTGRSGLIAALDTNKYYVDDSLNCCILMYNLEKVDRTTLRKRKIYVTNEGIELSKKYKLSYILPLLNSKLLNFYFNKILGYELNVYPESLEMFPIFKIDFSDVNKLKKINNLIDKSDMLSKFKTNYEKIIEFFNIALSNQPVEPRTGSFSNYFNNFELYNIRSRTYNNINEIKAVINHINVKEEGNDITIYISYCEEQKIPQKNIKAVAMTVEDDDLRNFLFLSIKIIASQRRGRGFGQANLLEIIKNLTVPHYVTNTTMNIEKIREVIKEFKNNTKELWWKDESKKDKFNTLTEMEKEINNLNNEINQFIYELYDIQEEEKRVIEDSIE